MFVFVYDRTLFTSSKYDSALLLPSSLPLSFPCQEDHLWLFQTLDKLVVYMDPKFIMTSLSWKSFQFVLSSTFLSIKQNRLRVSLHFGVIVVTWLHGTKRKKDQISHRLCWISHCLGLTTVKPLSILEISVNNARYHSDSDWSDNQRWCLS